MLSLNPQKSDALLLSYQKNLQNIDLPLQRRMRAV